MQRTDRNVARSMRPRLDIKQLNRKRIVGYRVEIQSAILIWQVALRQHHIQPLHMYMAAYCYIRTIKDTRFLPEKTLERSWRLGGGTQLHSAKLKGMNQDWTNRRDIWDAKRQCYPDYK